MKKWILISLGIVLLIGVTVFLSFIFHLNGVVDDIQAQGESLARSTPIKQVDEVDVYYGKEQCIVVQGKDAKGNPLMAWFINGKSEVDDAKKLVTRKSVVDTLKKSNSKIKILHVTPGKEGAKKFWEVVFLDKNEKYNYYYIDMYTGKLISTFLLEKAA
ncbi:MAG TPA: hypothetical protein DDY49_12840 [Paenibacillaceae bacterium]|nr:hypothetical protein [Paenibacillaceae bacterium]